MNKAASGYQADSRLARCTARAVFPLPAMPSMMCTAGTRASTRRVSAGPHHHVRSPDEVGGSFRENDPPGRSEPQAAAAPTTTPLAGGARHVPFRYGGYAPNRDVTWHRRCERCRLLKIAGARDPTRGQFRSFSTPRAPRVLVAFVERTHEQDVAGRRDGGRRPPGTGDASSSRPDPVGRRREVRTCEPLLLGGDSRRSDGPERQPASIGPRTHRGHAPAVHGHGRGGPGHSFPTASAPARSGRPRPFCVDDEPSAAPLALDGTAPGGKAEDPRRLAA